MILTSSIPGFADRKGPLGHVIAAGDADPREIDAALARFHDERDDLRLLKVDRKASVYAGLGLGGRRVCWKVFPSRRRARRSFRNLVDLQRLGVPVAEPFLLWERPRSLGSGAVLAMEDLAPRPPLDTWISARLESAPGGGASIRSLRPVCAALGALLRELHARGIFLDDLKTCNIFLDGEERPAFRFIDVDGARTGIRGGIGRRRRVKNLAQLNRSTPVGAGIGCRRAFWKEYRRGLDPALGRKIRREALARGAERPVVDVARTGTREEPWPARAGVWPR